MFVVVVVVVCCLKWLPDTSSGSFTDQDKDKMSNHNIYNHATATMRIPAADRGDVSICFGHSRPLLLM